MAIFDPMFVIPSDLGSVGVFLNSHNLEHLQLSNIALSQGVITPVYDLGVFPRGQMWGQEWLDSHQTMTAALSSFFGLPLPDLTQLNIEDEGSWRQWEIDNADWHMQARAAAGIM